MKYILISCLLWCIMCAGVTHAASHTILPKESFLNFYVTVNGATTNGSFTDYTMDIQFNPAVPEESSVTGVVKLNSKTITAIYDEVAKGVSESAWLDVINYPQATFAFTSFELVTPNHYKGLGTLTLLDKTLPITCNLILTSHDNGTVVADATILLDRIAFGVGKGEWADIETVDKVVTVHAHLVTRSNTPTIAR